MVWIYNGPISDQFGRCLCSNWYAETTADTKEQALNFLTYRAKKYLGLEPWVKISLDPSKLK